MSEQTRSDRRQLLVEGLLQDTSRTFALTIPLLGSQLREPVSLAYLLFRLADSIEDGPREDTQLKLRLLDEFRASLARVPAAVPGEFVAQCLTLWPDDPAIRRLFSAAPELLSMLAEVSPDARDAIASSLAVTIQGMSSFLHGASPGRDLELRDLEQLRTYCYYVAGVVGEMLTELFLLGTPEAEPARAELRRLGRAFGECLQLTNILKDAERDRQSRRSLLPAGLDREQVFALARESASAGRRYIERLQRLAFPEDVVRFCQLPLELAERTLPRVRRDGPGAKLSRQEVLETLRQVQAPARGVNGD